MIYVEYLEFRGITTGKINRKKKKEKCIKKRVAAKLNRSMNFHKSKKLDYFWQAILVPFRFGSSASAIPSRAIPQEALCL